MPRAPLMNCPVEYDDEKELAETHPDLLPTEGWSDPDDDEKVLSAAVQLIDDQTRCDTIRSSQECVGVCAEDTARSPQCTRRGVRSRAGCCAGAARVGSPAVRSAHRPCMVGAQLS